MSEITNPHDAYLLFTEAFFHNRLALHSCLTSPEIKAYIDTEHGVFRATYATIKNNVVKGILIIAQNGFENETPCFQLGIAVGESFRNQGIGLSLMQKGIKEFITRFPIPEGKSIIIEAVVSETNIASQKIAAKIFPNVPKKITDSPSNEAAFLYEMIIEKKG